MNKTAEEEEADHVESVILSQVCNLEMAASAVEQGSLVRLEVTDPRGGGEAATVRKSVLMSHSPACVLPVPGSGHTTAPGDDGNKICPFIHDTGCPKKWN